MMEASSLPVGEAKPPVSYPHFPTRWQAVVWRNWGVVPAESLAAVLGCGPADLRQAAEDMGLPADAPCNPLWLSRGYLTIIRSNWQLLPYSQLLQLLGWTPERMAYTLKEEDFFWTKLGRLKPEAPECRYAPLTATQKTATARLKANLRRYVAEDCMAAIDQPFAFLERFAPLSAPLSPSEQKKGDGAVEAPKKNETGSSQLFDFNFIHAYPASCGDVLGNWDKEDPVPENLLAQYASMGIKGVWIHALLYLLCPIPGAEEYSSGFERRMENLRRMVERCGKWGIKVYLYLNEPRCMPWAFYEKKPSWGGWEVAEHHTKTICITASREPLEWLESAVKQVFEGAPELGGAFCITMSENPTNCFYRGASHNGCPHCSQRQGYQIVADVVGAMERGMHAAAPDAKLIAYDWAWGMGCADSEQKLAFKKAVLDRLPKSVVVQSVSEWGMMTHIGGVEQYLVDYSISQVGPSRETLAVWEHARKLGLKVAAKVQFNNSWELSAVPYMPVPYLVQEHIDNLKRAGVSGLMLSWTLGGYPGGNLRLLTATPDEIAAERFHPELARRVCRAWRQFSEAFRQFPFNVAVLYDAPTNYGPMNLLHLQKTGYSATMVGFPYDDLKAWKGPYPEDVFLHQFQLVSSGWKEGLDTLEQARAIAQDSELGELDEILTVAQAAYCHLESTCQQIRFVMARNNGFDKDTMAEAATRELHLAKRLLALMQRDSRLGYEASNHYFYTQNDLMEKILSCATILDELK